MLIDRADALAAGADPGAHAAGAARPGDARARLLLRPALRGDRQPRRRLGRLRDRAAAGARQGLEGADAAGRRARPAGAASATWSAAGGRWRPIRASGRCSSPRAAGASPTPTSPAGSASGPAKRRSPRASRRTHFDIPLQPISWRVARICVRFRSCSATRRSRPPRSTPESMPPACATPTLPATRAHESDYRQTTVESPDLDGDRRKRGGAARSLAPLQGARATTAARERLVVAYSPMVKFVAGRLGAGLPSHVEDADLISYGLVGLIGAIERFEPERGIKFETFAMTRIRGSIIDELRSLDWVPRSVRSRAREIEAAQAKLEHELQRAPSEAELAAKLNMTEEELQSVAAGDRQLLRLRARRALDRLRLLRRPGLAARHDRRRRRRRPAGGARLQRGQGPADRGDRLAARARAARRRPLLLREPHPARDRRGPRGHRVARLPAAHQGRDAAEVPPPAGLSRCAFVSLRGESERSTSTS